MLNVNNQTPITRVVCKESIINITEEKHISWHLLWLSKIVSKSNPTVFGTNSPTEITQMKHGQVARQQTHTSQLKTGGRLNRVKHRRVIIRCFSAEAEAALRQAVAPHSKCHELYSEKCQKWQTAQNTWDEQNGEAVTMTTACKRGGKTDTLIMNTDIWNNDAYRSRWKSPPFVTRRCADVL